MYQQQQQDGRGAEAMAGGAPGGVNGIGAGGEGAVAAAAGAVPPGAPGVAGMGAGRDQAATHAAFQHALMANPSMMQVPAYAFRAFRMIICLLFVT